MSEKDPKRFKKFMKRRKAGVCRLPLRPQLLCGPQIPTPMHGLAPRAVLGEAWWNKTRKAAYESTGYCCLACGVYKFKAKARHWLEGHEVYNIDYVKGRMTYVETVPLCHYCHSYIHEGRLTWLLETFQIHHSKYVAIIKHGDEILLKNRLQKFLYNGVCAEWSQWRLVVNGSYFKPLYSSYEEYLEKHK